ncbi:hypothetical protein [Symmachiella dynata]|uniref:Uncharacterized protein n=1 Tax=Symmachiella dynata TaxID=2527995 RepID=A0A517ZIJ2_9PLAN|nr:hypothetical protein [Symmachiella dynata]QDT46783.1 hypothetical protein Pan258_08030 [Symmachiella dynata]QDU42291.1 hypothetical protein Mal52_07470 [Symmachiella dynata]
MPEQLTAGEQLARDIIDRVESLILEAEREQKPLELDPFRERLFELFVMAEATGFVLDGDADLPDLSSDGVGHELAQRWNLADAVRSSMEQQARLQGEQLVKMRLMWSFMRLWMEWTYAWQRWEEFHPTENSDPTT